MSSTLESEDLENVQLVRMEDVQPSRDRPCEKDSVVKEKLEMWNVHDSQKYDELLVKEEELETCIVDNLEYDNECVVDGNDDSYVEIMESVAEDIGVSDDGNAEVIVPEPLKAKVDIKPAKVVKAPDSWPTLEILPGGVINNLEKNDDDLIMNARKEQEGNNLMIYACAKCSERFPYLFSLVKHVRLHEVQARKLKEPDLASLCQPVQVIHIKSFKLPKSTRSTSKKHKEVNTRVTRRKIVKVPKKSKS